ncbi:MAG TPA: hypothetical protein VJ715_08255 [Pyrinomonadaceae bacterium]|nr:hypothetical protein [Pyrinomonadaceae bacterium]
MTDSLSGVLFTGCVVLSRGVCLSPGCVPLGSYSDVGRRWLWWNGPMRLVCDGRVCGYLKKTRAAADSVNYAGEG